MSTSKSKQPEKVVFQIIEIATGRVEHEIDVTSKNERGRERVEYGLIQKVDLDRFYVKLKRTSGGKA